MSDENRLPPGFVKTILVGLAVLVLSWLLARTMLCTREVEVPAFLSFGLGLLSGLLMFVSSFWAVTTRPGGWLWLGSLWAVILITPPLMWVTPGAVRLWLFFLLLAVFLCLAVFFAGRQVAPGRRGALVFRWATRVLMISVATFFGLERGLDGRVQAAAEVGDRLVFRIESWRQEHGAYPEQLSDMYGQDESGPPAALRGILGSTDFYYRAAEDRGVELAIPMPWMSVYIRRADGSWEMWSD